MGCVPVAEAPVEVGGRRPGPPVFRPAQRAQRPAESRLATCRRGAAPRSADLWPVLPVGAGIAERSEAKPHTPRKPTAALRSPRRSAINAGCERPGDVGHSPARRCRRP